MFCPLIFMAHEPQMPSLQDLLKVSVGSTSFFILISASRTCRGGLGVGRFSGMRETGAYHGSALVQVDCVRLEFGGSGGFIWVLFSRIRPGLRLDVQGLTQR